MAVYPSNASTDSDLYVALDNFGTTLNGAIDASQTTITLTSTTGLPTVGILTIDSEKIKYTGVSGNDITGCTRGFSSTSAATHVDTASVLFNVVEEHHNGLKDEVISIESDLYSAISADLNDSATVSATATDLKTRLDQIVTKIKEINTGSDWKDAVSKNLTQLVALDGSRTYTADQPMGGFKLTGLGAGSTAGDSVRYEQSILVDGANTFTANQPMGGFKLTGLGAGSTAGDSVRYEDVVRIADTQTITGSKTFSSQIIASSGLQTGSTILSDTDNTDDLGSSSVNWSNLYLKGDVIVGSTTAIDLASSGAVSIRGTATNDSPTTGFVGEYVESIVSTATNFPATAVFGDGTSISLTAGDWEVTVSMMSNINGSTWSSVWTGFSTTSGNSSTGLVLPSNSTRSSWSNSATTPIEVSQKASARLSLSSTTTIYVKVWATYTAGNPQYRVAISARRTR